MSTLPPNVSESPLGSEPQTDEPPRQSGATSSRAAPGTGGRTRTRAGKEKRGGSVQPPPVTSIPKKDPDDAAIIDCWSQVLGLPAIIHVLPGPYNCEQCANHIASTAPKAAKDLVKLSEAHPELRKTLVTVTNFFGGIGVLSSVGDLYGPSFANHGPYVPALTEMTAMQGAMHGIAPHRKQNEPQQPTHTHTTPRPTTGAPPRDARPAPPANPAPVAPQPNTGL